MGNTANIAEMMLGSKSTVVLTGAGISTESGIPDFRSPGTGLWERMDPEKALSSAVLYANPEEFYKNGFQILMSFENAEPNDGHLELARLEKMGFIDAIITQNIDGLHQKAGSKKVLEVHGTAATGSCEICGRSYPLYELEKRVTSGQCPPRCDCSGVLRPDVVLFGDSLPPSFEEAVELVRDCDFLLVVGSSLRVYPVARLPVFAKSFAVINYTVTPYDRRAAAVIHDGAGKTLSEIRELVEKGSKK